MLGLMLPGLIQTAVKRPSAAPAAMSRDVWSPGVYELTWISLPSGSPDAAHAADANMPRLRIAPLIAAWPVRDWRR